MEKLGYIHSYDIRGVFEECFTNENLQQLVKGIVSEFNPKKVVIGYDMRVSSPQMFEVVSNEFLSCGVNVVSIGLASTPQLYWATCTETSGIDCDLGIIITASHNPKEYNGMKICRQNAIPISYDTGLNEVERRILEDDFNVVEDKEIGSLTEINIQQKYLQYMLRYMNTGCDRPREKPLKIAVDYANGIACHSNKPYLEQLERDGFIECVHLYDDLDGTFPNHEANPLKEETLDALKQLVIDEECDFGLNYDGDADRVGFVDSCGNYVAPDIVGCFLVEHLSKHNEVFSTFCYDLRSTHELINVGNKYEKSYSKTRVGHSHIKKHMHEVNAEFSCELSGHFYFEQSNSRYDDALRATIEVICAYSYKSDSFKDVVDQYRTTIKSPEINFKVGDVKSKIDESKSWFNEFGTFEEDTLDGLSLEFEHFWINIRASNTEPVLRVNFEVTNNSQDLYDTVLQIIEEKLK